MPDALSRLADLPSTTPDPQRAARVTARCRARLARQAARARSRRSPGRRPVAMWQPLLLVLGAGYMAAVVVQTLNVYGVR
jgi:hypothetical protein